MPKYADDDEFNKDQYGNKLTINQLAEKILARRKRRKKAAFTQRTVEQASGKIISLMYLATDTDQTSQEDPTYINSVAVGTHDLPNDDGSTTSSIQNQETIDEVIILSQYIFSNIYRCF
ncbi:hypothetical protein RF11_08453 [Thelohanellus kitauei]|uniref:Uncharacterized protein n=1 Tax=Thelohanellus kitauei TaxID=669202 RepID=A0A0C2MVZ5_THEKT|nr:hypothetical protein RF11_08453 [Thelohanellus kitauei]